MPIKHAKAANVFLIDDNSDELKSLSENFDIKTLTDDPMDPGFYKNFKQKINYFIAVTKSDEKNILTCKFAKDFLKVDKTIARIRNQNLINEADDKIFKTNNEFLDYVIFQDISQLIFLKKYICLVLFLVRN